jgi:hypothetical protein
LYKLLLPYTGELSAEEIANADTIAKAFGIQPTDSFRKDVAVIERLFIFKVVQDCRAPVATAEHDLLTWMAEGPSEAAAVIRAARQGDLTWRQQRFLMRMLDGIDYGQFGEPVTVPGAERMVAHALAELPRLNWGPRPDTALRSFTILHVSRAMDRGVPPFPPARLVLGVSEALEHAVRRARNDPRARRAIKRFNEYDALSKDAIRNWVRDAAKLLTGGIGGLSDAPQPSFHQFAILCREPPWRLTVWIDPAADERARSLCCLGDRSQPLPVVCP